MPLKCPYCNVELEYAQLANSANGGDYYYEQWRGFCPKCGKNFHWNEIYIFSHCDSLEEIKKS